MTREEYHKSYTQRLMTLQLNEDLLRPIDMLNITLESISACDVNVLRQILGLILTFMLSKGAFGVHVSDEDAYYNLLELLMDCYLAQHKDMTEEQFIEIIEEEKNASKKFLLDQLK